MTVTLTRTIDDAEFWSSIMGSTEFGFEWWLRVKYLGDADWDKPGLVQLTVMDENNEPLTKVLTLDDLVKAYEEIVAKKHWHCGVAVDIEDMDECASDLVLQQAMFGEVIYS